MDKPSATFSSLFTDGLQNARSGDQVSFRVRFEKAVMEKAVYAVYKALVFRMFLLANGCLEGGRFDVQLCGGVSVVNIKLFNVLALRPLRDEGCVLLDTGSLNLHQVKTSLV
jgi:hypothetical protein